MLDDSIPPEDQSNQEERPGGGPHDNIDHHRIEAKSYLVLAFWVFAESISIFGREHIAAFVLYVVIACFLGFFTYHAIKGWPLHKRVWSWIYAGSCISVALFLFYISRTKSPVPIPFPSFIIGLETYGNSAQSVPLTNDCLIAAQSGLFSSVDGYLLIPTSIDRSNIVLEFNVFNDSLVTAKDVNLIVWFPKEWECSPGFGWERSAGDSLLRSRTKLPSGILQTNTQQSFIYRFPHDLLWHNAEIVPGIQITTGMGLQGWRFLSGPIALALKSEQPSIMAISCLTVFVPESTNPPLSTIPMLEMLTKPQVVCSRTNAKGEQWLNISSNQLRELQK